jgi:hypothetical protein
MGVPRDEQALKRLFAVAAQDGELDPAEKGLLRLLPVDRKLRPLRDGFLRTRRKPINPEVVLARKIDPAFDKRLAALKAAVKPGDVLLWRKPDAPFPWSFLNRTVGQWQHTSVVLEGGKLMDPHWPSGAAVATIESSLARGVVRVGPADVVISRMEKPLTAKQIRGLTELAREQEGRPFRLVTHAGAPSPAVSCSRQAWEMFKAIGVDLAPRSNRIFKTLISPGDLLQRPAALVTAAGETVLNPAGVRAKPTSSFLIRWPLRAADFLAERMPALIRWTNGIQDRIIRWSTFKGVKRLRL